MPPIYNPPPMTYGKVVDRTCDRPGELLRPRAAAPRATFESKRTGIRESGILRQQYLQRLLKTVVSKMLMCRGMRNAHLYAKRKRSASDSSVIQRGATGGSREGSPKSRCSWVSSGPKGSPRLRTARRLRLWRIVCHPPCSDLRHSSAESCGLIGARTTPPEPRDASVPNTSGQGRARRSVMAVKARKVQARSSSRTEGGSSCSMPSSVARRDRKL